MKNKWLFFAVSGLFLGYFVLPVFGVVHTSRIDRVRNKEVLESADLRVIDGFVAAVMEELVATVDFTSISKTRAIILSRVGSNQDSAAAQYSGQFSESVHKHLSECLDQAQMLAPEQLRFKVVLNLLVLLDSLEDAGLVEVALRQLDDKSDVIRYMAVRAATNPNVIRKLKQSNSADDWAVTIKIAEKLKGLVVLGTPNGEQSGPEILALAAEFSAELDIGQGEQLLLQIADLRIKSYADWSVKDELLDITVLKALSRKLDSAGSDTSAVGRRFGQLYSYAMQKYIRDLRDGSFLTTPEKRRLASVQIETEKACSNKLLGTTQTAVKRAVDAGDYISLQAEHDRLLGNETSSGLLAEKLRFDYGKNPNGVARVEPLILPEKPAD